MLYEPPQNIMSLDTTDLNEPGPRTCGDTELLARFYLGGALQRGETTKWTGSIADVNIFLEAFEWNPCKL